MTLRTFGHPWGVGVASQFTPAGAGRARPLTRIRNVRVGGSSIVVVAVVMLVASHETAGRTGSTSIVYCCSEPGIVRHGRAVDPFQGWLTGSEPPMSVSPGTVA